jgi:DNA-directed RNA polymerase III subunit RPC8
MQTKVADLVQITPSDFKKSSIDAIHDNINAKYANKVNLSLPAWATASSALTYSEGDTENWLMHMPMGCTMGE